MINSQISVAAVSAMPPDQAGLASGIASASRMVGQALGVAIAGSLLTAKAHGHMSTGFLLASNQAWHLLFWCAAVVVVAGLLTTRVRARHSATSSARNAPTAPHDVLVEPPSPAQPLISQTLPMRVPQASDWVPRFMRSPLAPDHSGYQPVFPGDSPGWPEQDWRGWFSADRKVGSDRPALDGAPDVGWGQRHVRVHDAEWGERVDD
jgi:MFS family permease